MPLDFLASKRQRSRYHDYCPPAAYVAWLEGDSLSSLLVLPTSVPVLALLIGVVVLLLVFDGRALVDGISRGFPSKHYSMDLDIEFDA